jgi:hypothetical protein
MAARWIEIGEGALVTLIDAEHDRLVDGFHCNEPDENLRWTGVDARLPDGWFAGRSRAIEVAIHVQLAIQHRGRSRRVKRHLCATAEISGYYDARADRPALRQAGAPAPAASRLGKSATASIL